MLSPVTLSSFAFVRVCEGVIWFGAGDKGGVLTNASKQASKRGWEGLGGDCERRATKQREHNGMVALFGLERVSGGYLAAWLVGWLGERVCLGGLSRVGFA